MDIYKETEPYPTESYLHASTVYHFMSLTSSAGGHRANSSGCLLPCRASWLKRSSSSWLLKSSSPSTFWSGVKYRRLKSDEVSERPQSSLSCARVGDMTWGKSRERPVRVVKVGHGKELRVKKKKEDGDLSGGFKTALL